MKRPVLALVLLALAAFPGFARVRVVRHPATPCSFSLLPTWGDAVVPAVGANRAIVQVYGQSPACAQWAAYSDADWVTVEAAPMDAQPSAYVTVAPNPVPAARSTTIIIAGLPLVVRQEAGNAVAPDTSIVANGTFNKDVANWGWYTRFPNGLGDAKWSALDANGSPASGSMVLKDNDYNINYGFQRLQCVPANKDTLYTWGTKVRTGSPVESGDVVIAFLEFQEGDCSGLKYLERDERIINPGQPGVWQSFSFATLTSRHTASILIVLDSHGKVSPPFETWFDDVFVRPE